MSLQREREGRDEILHSGDQFGTFRGFGSFGSRRSVFPSLFGGRDPFDDPFFIRPYGSLFESNIYGPPPVSSYKMETNPSKGIVIEELDEGDQGHEDKASGSDKDNRQKYSASSIEPSVEHPDDVANGSQNFVYLDIFLDVCCLGYKCVIIFAIDLAEGKSKKITYKKLEGSHPQSRSYSFQTSKVTYGGIDGAYYTSSRTRRAGHDGVSNFSFRCGVSHILLGFLTLIIGQVVIEEAKEADKTTGQATHRISRGIQNKVHLFGSFMQQMYFCDSLSNPPQR